MQVGGSVEGARVRLVSRASEGHTDSIFFEHSPPRAVCASGRFRTMIPRLVGSALVLG